MYQHQTAVREQAIALPNGCSMRGKCPECGGTGAFSITRTNSELAYICFSASCKYRGVITSKSNNSSKLGQSVTRQRKLFNGTLTALESYEEDWLHATFNIDYKWLTQVRFNPEDMRVYYPQYDISGRLHGYIARHYPKLDHNKPTKGAKALWKVVKQGEVGLLFPSMSVLSQVVKLKRLCVVEDYPSMLRINSQLGIPTCCLGGTNIYESHTSTILTLDVRELIIILDADAITKAIKLKRSLSLAFDNVIVVPLTGVDPKDMTVEELNEVLKYIR